MVLDLHLPDQLNVAAYFLDPNLTAERRDRIAVIADDRQATYAEVAELANRAGNVFLDLGIEPEQRIALLLPDTSTSRRRSGARSRSGRCRFP